MVVGQLSLRHSHPLQLRTGKGANLSARRSIPGKGYLGGAYSTVMEEPTVMKEEVEKAIEEIKHRLRADGGDIELVDVDEEGVVKVRLKGACLGCPMSQITLKWGVERYLKTKIPQVKRVVTV